MPTNPVLISKEFAQRLIDYLVCCPYKEVYPLVQELMSAAQPNPMKEVKSNVSSGQ